MKKLLLSVFVLSATSTAFAQWTTQNSNLGTVSRGISDIQIVDANTVWALAYDGAAPTNDIQEFTRTTNGGTTWTGGIIELNDSSLAINNLQPINGTTAWVSAINADDTGGSVYKTTDGGLNWIRKNPGGYAVAGVSFLNVVHFFDANIGITQGDPIGIGVGKFEIYRTTDGGTTWAAIDSPAPVSAEYGYNNGNVAAGNTFWFVTNKGKIYRTTDTGLTYTKLNTPITDFGAATQSGKIHFADNNNGILIGTATAGSTLYKTTDGGTTWSTGTPYTAGYAQMDYIKGTTVLIATNPSTTPPTVAISTDHASTWTVVDSGTQRNGIAFLNATTGWAGGFVSSTLTGGIYKYAGPSLSVKDLASATKLKAYPNPVNDVLQLSGASLNEVTVYDILGKQVLSQNFAAQDGVSLNVSSLKAGIYLLNATNDLGATETLKFAKQ